MSSSAPEHEEDLASLIFGDDVKQKSQNEKERLDRAPAAATTQAEPVRVFKPQENASKDELKMATKALKAEDHPAPEETGHTEKKPARGKRKSQRLREVQTSKTLDDDDIGEPEDEAWDQPVYKKPPRYHRA